MTFIYLVIRFWSNVPVSDLMILYFHNSSKIKSLQKTRPQFEHQEDYVYNLGNDVRITDPETATIEFLKREFPQILESGKEPHQVLFIPDTFLYGDIARKVIVFSFFFLLNLVPYNSYLWSVIYALAFFNSVVSIEFFSIEYN